jgi:hypothetical protein
VIGRAAEDALDLRGLVVGQTERDMDRYGHAGADQRLTAADAASRLVNTPEPSTEPSNS